MPAFQVKDVCLPDAPTALNYWKAQFPTPPDANGAMWYVNTASINVVSGVITGTLKRSTSSVTTNITGVTLPACTPDVQTFVFDKYPVQEILFPVALILCFIFGFGQGRAK